MLRSLGKAFRQTLNLRPTAADFLEAARTGDEVVVNRYITNNAGNTAALNATNDEGETALMLAAKTGQTAIVKKLVATPGTNINATMYFGSSALLLATDYTDNLEVVNTLLDARAEVNQASQTGSTPLMLAVHNGGQTPRANTIAIVQTLLSHKADVMLESHPSSKIPRIAEEVARVFVKNDVANLLAQERIQLVKKGLQKTRVGLSRPAAMTFQERLDAIEYKGDIPPEFMCPITQGIINDPVTLSNGHTVDRLETLIWHFQSGDQPTFRCPKSNMVISCQELKFGTSVAMKPLINKFVMEQEERAKPKQETKPQEETKKEEAQTASAQHEKETARKARLRMYAKQNNAGSSQDSSAVVNTGPSL